MLTQDAMNYLLRWIPPRDALSLRATCHEMSQLVGNAQLYWYYQCEPSTVKAHKDGTQINACWFNNTPTFKLIESIEQNNPEASVGFIDDKWRCIRKHKTSIDFHYCYFGNHIDATVASLTPVGLQPPNFDTTQGQWMYQFLFQQFKKATQYFKRIPYKRRERILLEEQIRYHEEAIHEKKRHLNWIRMYEENDTCIQDSPFFRKQLKKYHKTRKRKRRKKK
jgi:hypothetical protein